MEALARLVAGPHDIALKRQFHALTWLPRRQSPYGSEPSAKPDGAGVETQLSPLYFAGTVQTARAASGLEQRQAAVAVTDDDAGRQREAVSQSG